MAYPEQAWSTPDDESIQFNSKLKRVGEYVGNLAIKFYNSISTHNLQAQEIEVLQHTINRYAGFSTIRMLTDIANNPNIPTKKTCQKLLPKSVFSSDFLPYLDKQIALYENRCHAIQTKIDINNASDNNGGTNSTNTLLSDLNVASAELMRLIEAKNIYLKQGFI